MNEMVRNALLSSVLYPMVLGLVLPLLTAKMGGERSHHWATALGLVAGFLACFYTTVPWAGYPPVQVFGWIPLIGVLGAGALLALANRPAPLRLVGICLIVLYATHVFLTPVAKSWNPMMLYGVITAITLLWGLTWWGNEFQQDHSLDGLRTLLMVVFATGTSLLSVLGGSAKLAQVSGGLAAACGAVFLARLLNSNLRVGSSARGLFYGSLGCCLLNGFFYVELELWQVLLVVLSGQAHLLLHLPAIQRLKPTPRAILVCVLALLPVIAALVGAALNQPEDEYAY